MKTCSRHLVDGQDLAVFRVPMCQRYPLRYILLVVGHLKRRLLVVFCIGLA